MVQFGARLRRHREEDRPCREDRHPARRHHRASEGEERHQRRHPSEEAHRVEVRLHHPEAGEERLLAATKIL